jgi:hypothetical protein
MAKGVCESQPRLDIRYLERTGNLRPGTFPTLSWTSEGRRIVSVWLWPGPISLTICKNPDGEWAEQRIGYEWTPQHLGGRRRWFRCPDCGSRCAILYLSGRRFRCRECSHLSYHSQQVSGHWRAVSQAQSIRMRMGASGNLMLPFPDKPKGMHWTRYHRLQDRAHTYESIGFAALTEHWQAKTSSMRRQ